MPFLDAAATALQATGPFQLLGHLSYALATLSFMLRDILLLRLVAVAASTANLTYAYFGHATPNWVTAGWQSLFILINLFWSARLIYERRRVRFGPEEQELFDSVFSFFNPVEFRKLIRLARWDRVAAQSVLARCGEKLDTVILLYSGEVTITMQDGSRRNLRDGAFIGEISYLRGGPATATVTTATPCRLLRFDKQALRALVERNPAMRNNLHTVFSMDLTKKLTDPQIFPKN